MPIELVHPMLVHFPIVIVLLAVLSDLWWLARGRPAVGLVRLETGTVLLAIGAVFAVAAFVFGDLAYDIAVSDGVPVAMLESHEGWGTTTTIVFAAAALLRLVIWWRSFGARTSGRAVAIGATAVVAVMVLVTAYFGGALVYEHGVGVQTGGELAATN